LHTNKKIKISTTKYWIAPFLVIGAIASCAVTKAENSSSAPLISFSGAIKMITGYQSTIEIASTDPESTILHMTKNFCSSETEDKRSIQFNLLTTTGSKSVSLDILPGDKDIVDFMVDGQSRGFLSKEALSGVLEHTSEICDLGKTQISHSNGSDIIEALNISLDSISPDCRFRTTKNHFVCIPTKVDVNRIQNSLSQANKNILKKIKRPPYILMRKLSITRQFANAISQEDGLEKICKLSKHSLKEEIPLVMRTYEWKEGVCLHLKHQLTRLEIYEALRLAHKEIKLLEAAAIKNSSRGIVSIKLPKSITKGHKNLFVELSPSVDVYEEITSSRVMSSLPANTSLCWHPFAADGSSAGQNLFALGLVKTEESSCLHDAVNFSSGIKEVASSITGDANFIVSNYRGKLVRLPKGTYEYEISALPSDPRSNAVNSGTIIKKGSFSWTGKRYTTIR
jgi:hypothetical protein